MSYAFTPLDFVCSHCNAVAGIGCKTRSGEIADYHKARIADCEADRDAYNLLQAEAQALVPAIALTGRPVRQLKEKFTLAGEPMAISACMLKLGIAIRTNPDSSGQRFCEVPEENGLLATYLYSPKGHHPHQGRLWEYGTCAPDAETFKTKQVDEAHVLMDLIRRFYMLKLKKTPAEQPVLTSLSARLLPLASPVQLDTLRTELKALRA